MKSYKYKKLADTLLAQIKDGSYPPHTRLPPIRTLAAAHGVNTATAIGAYKYLERLGRVHTRAGSGTYVSVPGMPEPGPPQRDYINFAGGDTDPMLFPAEAFGQAVAQVLATQGKAAFAEPIMGGYAPLREALAEEKGIDPRRVFILSGMQQGHEIFSEIKKNHAHVKIEEDFEGDFYYNSTPPWFLWEAEPHGVVYVKSYGKILMPGLAHMVVPEAIQEACAEYITGSAPGLVQRAFNVFVRGGGFAAHTARMRAVYGRRYRKTIEAAGAYLPGYAGFDTPGTGLTLNLYPKGKYGKDIDTLCQRLLQRKVILSPISPLKISFAAVPEERAAEGIGIIAAVLATMA
ncbi:MAG: PLP-dependent aminotransferase family protein [Defluviitaleaceae bacterium]|nr:PLP-dependent aminotransferase family protein [Defluviitaleaceae bacterium]